MYGLFNFSNLFIILLLSFSLIFCLAQILGISFKCVLYILFSIFNKEDILVRLRKRNRRSYSDLEAYKGLQEALKKSCRSCVD